MIPANNVYRYLKTRVFGGPNDNRNVAFGPERMAIRDQFGGGIPYVRQLHLVRAVNVQQFANAPVSITGNGADLTGMLTSLPLIDTSNN